MVESAGSTICAVIVSLPTPQPSGMISLGVLQVGLPSPTPIVGLFGLTETWFTGGSTVFVPLISEPWRVFRIPLAPGVLPQIAATAQLVVFLTLPVGPGGGCSSLYSASPGMWFPY